MESHSFFFFFGLGPALDLDLPPYDFHIAGITCTTMPGLLVEMGLGKFFAQAGLKQILQLSPPK
jgi:hypothetical protein